MSPYKQSKSIDREKERQLFRDLLVERTSPYLLLFQDKSGTGKSWLLEMLEQEAGYPAVGARVVLEEGVELRAFVSQINTKFGRVGTPLTRYEELAEAREARDHRPFGLPEPPRVDINVAIENTTMIDSVVKGGDVIMPWPVGYDQKAERACLNALLDDIRDLSRRRPTVLLLDQFERASSEIKGWLDEVLLTRILDDADPFGPLIIVVASNDEEFVGVVGQLGPRRGDCFHKAPLSRWEDRHIEQYFRQTGVRGDTQQWLRGAFEQGVSLLTISGLVSELRKMSEAYDESA